MMVSCLQIYSASERNVLKAWDISRDLLVKEEGQVKMGDQDHGYVYLSIIWKVNDISFP